VQEQDYINTINDFKKIIDDLRKIVDEQRIEIENLKEEIRILKAGKNSKNSSLPPSTDIIKPNQSLRIRSGKKPGGQLGHEGKTLEIKAVPDQIIQHIPQFCNCCGKDLYDREATLQERRQVVDIPPVKAVYTEHQLYSKKCRCGHSALSSFPAHVTSTIQYGSGVESIIAYMSVRQYLPYARMCEYLEHVHQLPMSEGSIANILERFFHKAQLPYEKIKQKIAISPVVGGDESGCKINGEKFWTFTWQNECNTYLSISKSRGHQGIKETFQNGLPESILVSDAWPAQLSTPAKSHQLCMAHLLRELNYFTDVLKDSWAERIKVLIENAIELKRKLQEKDYLYPIEERVNLEKRLDELLGDESQHTKIKAFRKRLIKNRNYIFEFLYHHKVPPDNNASERAIRNVKVKQKVSGQFKSLLGANIFVSIRAIIDTALKRNLEVFKVLQEIAIFRPE